MTSYAGGPVAPKKTLVWIGTACIVVGLVLSAIFVVRLVQNLPDTPTRVDGSPVQLKSEGLTVYSSEPMKIAPCTAKDASGADIALERVKGSQTISVNGRSWYAVAQSVDKVPPQEVVVACENAGTTATFYAGSRLAVGSLVGSVLLAIGSFLVFFLIGIGLIIFDGVRRRKARRKATMAHFDPKNPNPRANTFPTIGQNGVDPDYPVPPADQAGYRQYGGPGTGNDGVDPDYPAPPSRTGVDPDYPAPPAETGGVDPDYPTPPAKTDGVDPDYPAPPAETDGVDPDYPAPPR